MAGSGTVRNVKCWRVEIRSQEENASRFHHILSTEQQRHFLITFRRGLTHGRAYMAGSFVAGCTRLQRLCSAPPQQPHRIHLEGSDGLSFPHPLALHRYVSLHPKLFDLSPLRSQPYGPFSGCTDAVNVRAFQESLPMQEIKNARLCEKMICQEPSRE